MMDCPRCGKLNPASTAVCVHCAGTLPAPEYPAPMPVMTPEPERRWVTALFSDLSNYTTLTTLLGSEEARSLMGQIFEEIGKISLKHEGSIERFFGDEVLILFGTPITREDDAVRAVFAALEIHSAVAKIGQRLWDKIRMPLRMHTGIATGWVVSGDEIIHRKRHGLTGKAVNLAARMTAEALPDQILVSPETRAQILPFFCLSAAGALRVSDTGEPVPMTRVVSAKAAPQASCLISSENASVMVGRSAETAALDEALSELHRGKPAAAYVLGRAGTGKSRLVQEFKYRVGGRVRWIEAHVYSFSRSIPHYLFKDLFNRMFCIGDTDDREAVMAKLTAGLGGLSAECAHELPVVARLYDLTPPGGDQMGPQAWQKALLEAVLRVFDAIAGSAATVFFIEDIHWIDPVSCALLKEVFNRMRAPALIILTSRSTDPPLDMTPGGYAQRAILLTDLSSGAVREMVCATLKADRVPSELLEYLCRQSGGNPFYLEELILFLKDHQGIIRGPDGWHLKDCAEIGSYPSSLQGIIQSRMDCLEAQARKILQEVAVIGNQFTHALIGRVTRCPEELDGSLDTLEKRDFIRKEASLQGAVYLFKHAIVRDVIYGGLLKGCRVDIHERVAMGIEAMFDTRLTEVLQPLAYHYARGRSKRRAIDFMIQLGQKAFRENAVTASNEAFQSAFDAISAEPVNGKADVARLVDLLLKWFFPLNAAGVFGRMMELLQTHEPLVASLDSAYQRGMYYACLGWAMQRREQLAASREYLLKALDLAHGSRSDELTAFAATILIYVSTDLGNLAEALEYGRKAQQAMAGRVVDRELTRFLLTGLGIAYWFRGESAQCGRIAKTQLGYGQANNDLGSISEGHLIDAMGRFAAADHERSMGACQEAMATANDPLYRINTQFLIAYNHIAMENAAAAAPLIENILRFTEKAGYEYIGTAARALSALLAVGTGDLKNGIGGLTSYSVHFSKIGKRYHYAVFEYLLGVIFSRFVIGGGPLGWRVLARHFLFLLATFPVAAKRAERHLKNAVEMAERIQAWGVWAEANYSLGLLYGKKKCRSAAIDCLKAASSGFRHCSAAAGVAKTAAALSALGMTPPEAQERFRDFTAAPVFSSALAAKAVGAAADEHPVCRR